MLFDTRYPFKRNFVVPVGDVLNYVHQQSTGRTALMTNDPIVAYYAGNGVDTYGAYELPLQTFSKEHYATVIVVNTETAADKPFAQGILNRVRSDYAVAAEIDIARDEETALKNRFRDRQFSEWVVHVTVFRRELPAKNSPSGR